MTMAASATTARAPPRTSSSRLGDDVLANALRPRRLRSAHGLGRAPAVRVGLHHGPAVARDGDYFGAAVNLAARVSAARSAGRSC